ncbi:hypothetical protein [Ideonella sp. A 288]|uniref:hypothetical protein n=1 Tax=Ideonella sp. A 288 TaxID=1962181 RepID=UPI000B4A5D09|nr:hypothetical protein [Ideonella sp. A 288]
MNNIRHLVLLVPFALASSMVTAQYVKGNEAVRVLADGTRTVLTPPLPTTGPIRSTTPCRADGGCNGGPWHMVETKDGLVECTEAYARPGTCRKSTYGTAKLIRLWVVKIGDKWLQCQRPDTSSKCVDMRAPPPTNLPYPAVQ